MNFSGHKEQVRLEFEIPVISNKCKCSLLLETQGGKSSENGSWSGV